MDSNCINCHLRSEVICSCSSNTIPLCRECIGLHFSSNLNAEHTIRPRSPSTPKVSSKPNMKQFKGLDSFFQGIFGCCKAETEPHFEINDDGTHKPQSFKKKANLDNETLVKTPKNMLSIEGILEDLAWNLRELDAFKANVLDSKVRLIKYIEEEVDIILEDISLLEDKIKSDIDYISQSPYKNSSFAARGLSFYRSNYDFPISSKIVNCELDITPVFTAISSMYSFSMNSLHDSVVYLKPDSNQLSTYNIPTKLISTAFISTSTPFLPQSSYISISNNLLFLCGGISSKGYSDSSAIINTETSTCTQLPPMHFKRARPGLCILNNSIYIFGGYNGSYLKSSEKFDISTQSWEILPDMLEARAAVVACSVGSSIYLTGGFSISIEVFHPFQTPACYTKLPFSIPVQCTEGLMYTNNDEILILNHDKVFEFDLLTNDLVQIDSIPYKCWWSANGVIVFGNEGYFLQGDVVCSYSKNEGLAELYKFK
jgi:hypothetical protein